MGIVQYACACKHANGRKNVHILRPCWGHCHILTQIQELLYLVLPSGKVMLSMCYPLVIPIRQAIVCGPSCIPQLPGYQPDARPRRTVIMRKVVYISSAGIGR